MVEKVARALREFPTGRYDHAAFPISLQELARARAAIEALRTPTAEILRALDNAAGYPSAEAWGDAIDAALTSHTDTPKET